ncbi:MAG: carboxypeptidase regulatory-like domain-containing protein [Ginsengibacter sp.]
MKKIILIGSILFSFVNIYAQTEAKGKAKISGRVLDSSSGSPLDHATITVFVKGEEKPLTGTTANSTGNFEVSDLPSGNFTFDTVQFLSRLY